MSMQTKENYLKKTLPNYVPAPANNKFWFRYNLKRLQRGLTHFLIIFFCQFIAIGASSYSVPVSPLYAPMGVAFVMLYWFGPSSIAALFCASVIAYLLQGMSLPFVMGYSLADILPATLAIFLWADMGLSENPNCNQCREWLRFIFLKAGFVCLLSASLRILPIFFIAKEPSLEKVFYHGINLWLADINGVLVLFAFAMNWLYLAYSRSVIVPKKSLRNATFWLFCVFLVLSILFFKSTIFYYGIFLSMLYSVCLAYQTGIIFGSGLMYVVSFLYYAYFTINKIQLVFHYGFKFYTLVSILLFIYNISLILSANLGRTRRKYGNKG